jgi:phosphoserine phosphatase
MLRLTRAGCVVLDCDSTLSAVEGIDELAGAHRAAIAGLTDAAMAGTLPLEEVYGRRLALIRPSRRRVEALGELYVERLVPDAREVVQALRGEGVQLRIMSGGLRTAVLAVARALGIPDADVFAVDVRFQDDGSYAGHDAASPLTRSGGKEPVMRALRRGVRGPVIMVGDGITDLEARPAADLFVAYAGVVARAPVVAAADVVIRSASLAPLLPLALAGEPPSAPAALPLFRRGMDLLDPEYHACFPNAEGRSGV